MTTVYNEVRPEKPLSMDDQKEVTNINLGKSHGPESNAALSVFCLHEGQIEIHPRTNNTLATS